MGSRNTYRKIESKKISEPVESPAQKHSLARRLIIVGILFLFAAIYIIGLTFLPVVKQEVRYLLLSSSDKKIISENNDYKGNDAVVPVNPDFSIIIPKISANVAVIESVDPYNPKEYQVALSKGVAHAKGTALPGLGGNTFIFAHSSDSFYNANRYNSVFYLLNKLELRDKFMLVRKGDIYEYSVSEKQIISPDQIEYLQDTKEPQVTLMTCWPPGTTLQRLIVIGKLVNVSKLP